MLVYSITIIAGFLLLVWGADRFVLGASATAQNLGVSPLLIGMTIVGFGTSAPEILVSANAALSGSPGLAVGNAIGSNIANIALILGATALVMPLTIRSATLRGELRMLLAATFGATLPFVDGRLSRLDGLALLAGLGLMIYLLIRLGVRSRISDPMLAEVEAEIRHDINMPTAMMWLAVGLVVLLGASRALVWAAVGIAEALGVSDLVIGLTVVAIGTSLPELAASLTAAVRNEHDLAIGNVIGSNMYNLLAVLGVAGVLAPLNIERHVLIRDIPLMIALTLVLFVMSLNYRGKGRITRLEGLALLVTFVAYQLFVLMDVS
ncbi:MAG: calcium/sodium antiporter [Gammaproteobacteria bacterium]|nr:calcium/sodium antiporter [Gammaproteobacteria bacterium]